MPVKDSSSDESSSDESTSDDVSIAIDNLYTYIYICFYGNCPHIAACHMLLFQEAATKKLAVRAKNVTVKASVKKVQASSSSDDSESSDDESDEDEVSKES